MPRSHRASTDETSPLASPPDHLYAQLRDLVRAAMERSRGIKGIALCSSQGLPIVDSFSGEHDIATIAAMAEMTRTSGTKVFQNLGYVGPSHLLMHGEDVEILVWSVNRDTSLIAVADAGTEMGGVKGVLGDLAGQLESLLRR